MARHKEADKRLFGNVFVCKVCKAKRKADPHKVKSDKVKCRKCNAKKLRPKNREIRTSTGAGAAAAATKDKKKK